MNLDKFLEQNVKPATGCTEPVAVGLATALAYHALAGGLSFSGTKPRVSGKIPQPDFEKINGVYIQTDRDVYKNALAVAIPGTSGQQGMHIACAMGLYADPQNGMNLFCGLGKDTFEKADRLVKHNLIKVEEVTGTGAQADLDIKVRVVYRPNGKAESATVRLQHEHDNISEIHMNDKKMYSGNGTSSKAQIDETEMDLGHLIDLVNQMEPYQMAEAYKGIIMNTQIALEGLKKSYGLSLGPHLQNILTSRKGEGSLVDRVRIMAACAGDARMGGADIPVMSTAGSGNQGITALMPIAVAGDYYNFSESMLGKAAMLSHLVTYYAKKEAGHLSALCGCAIKAGIGAAAGLTYLLGGNREQINNAINLVSANITGMVCDGAKYGCALKLSTAAGVATESALMALRGAKVPADNGIIYSRAEDTIKAIGKISEAMVPVDQTVVSLMHNKECYS